MKGVRPRELLATTAHRPWPLPSGPWVMTQRWHALLFAHWPASAAELAPLVPAGLELDRFEGEPWVGVVPFRMSGVRLRATPVLGSLSAFPELNVRTYVTHRGRPGVLFFSLDAGSALAVRVARAWFGLPYFDARMRCEEGPDETLYRSTRVCRGAPPAELVARYGPVAPVEPAPSGSLEHWLTERYALYAQRKGRLLRGEIHHAPWPLQRAEAELETNTMARAAGLTLPGTRPLLHFARRLDVCVWAPRDAEAG